MGSYLFCKKRKLNSILYGLSRMKKKNAERKPVDLTDYMDDTFEPGLDDDLDITLNPVMIHRMEMMKRAAKKNAPRKSHVGKTGGLARLNLGQFDGPKGAQSHTSKNMDKYLDAMGVSSDPADKKQPAKGSQEWKKAQRSIAAVRQMQGADTSQTSARAGARLAIHAALQQSAMDDDEPSPAESSRKSCAALARSASSKKCISTDLASPSMKCSSRRSEDFGARAAAPGMRSMQVDL